MPIVSDVPASLLIQALLSLDAGLIIYDQNGEQILFSNAKSRDLWPTYFATFEAGKSREEATALQVKELYPNDSAQTQGQVVRYALDIDETSPTKELKATRGRTIIQRRTAFGDLGFITLSIDITELKEKELRARMDTQRAEEASSIKSKFLAHMSHELRTPLNAILGLTEAVLQDELTPTQRERLSTVSAAGESLLVILNDILDLSKVEAGKLELEKTRFDLQELTRSVAAAFALKADEKGIAFNIEIEQDVPVHLIGDPTRIRQILGNLISNAIKFTDQGSVSVHLDLTPTAGAQPDGLLLHGTVTDTGLGMDKATLQRLFKPFTQADESISRSHGGTGLGLSICNELANLMGGQVSASSTPGEGSTFTFEIPVQKTQAPETTPSLAGAPNADTNPDQNPTIPYRKILVAEDNAVNRMVLKALLERYPCEITFAIDGSEALSLWRNQHFDCILMDIHMPVMNGVTATKTIRAEERAGNLPRIPIIALTADVMRHQVQDYIDSGVDDVVGKPVQIQKLKDSLHQVAYRTSLDEAHARNTAG